MSTEEPIKISPRYGREDEFIYRTVVRKGNISKRELFDLYLKICEVLNIPNIYDHKRDISYMEKIG